MIRPMSEQPPQNPAQPPPNPYQPYAAPGPQFGVPDHPKAATVLVLGIVGIAVCQLVAPFAWVIGGRVRKEIDESGGRYGGRSQAQIGYILGIVGSALLALYLVGGIVYIVFVIAIVASSA